jgi:hypothetical protein
MPVPTRKPARAFLLAAACGALLALLTPGARADEGDECAASADADSPQWMRELKIDERGEQARAFREQESARKAAEKELRRLRLSHFGIVRKESIRQEGLAKLRTFTDPALYPAMIDAFGREQDDVRATMLDVFAESDTQEGDASLAWTSVFGRDQALRTMAIERLRARIEEAGAQSAGEQVRLVIYEGLRSGRAKRQAIAASLANELNLIELIPWLAATQVGARAQGASAGGGSRDGALAWILVGQQTAYVSDLEPVVAESAVAFDPQLSVVTTGTIMKVNGAVVYTYHYDIHNALVDLSSRNWGRSTRSLGWSYPEWMRWYDQELQPFVKANAERDRKLAMEKHLTAPDADPGLSGVK